MMHFLHRSHSIATFFLVILLGAICGLALFEAVRFLTRLISTAVGSASTIQLGLLALFVIWIAHGIRGYLKLRKENAARPVNTAHPDNVLRPLFTKTYKERFFITGSYLDCISVTPDPTTGEVDWEVYFKGHKRPISISWSQRTKYMVSLKGQLVPTFVETAEEVMALINLDHSDAKHAHSVQKRFSRFNAPRYSQLTEFKTPR